MEDSTKKVESFRPGVHLPNIMQMACEEMRAPGVIIGFSMALNSLNRIAERAMEIGDEKILEELEHMSIITRCPAEGYKLPSSSGKTQLS